MTGLSDAVGRSCACGRVCGGERDGLNCGVGWCIDCPPPILKLIKSVNVSAKAHTLMSRR